MLREPYPWAVHIDLHTHSVASDGTETPAEVVASAVRAGLDVVALTDHDSTRGWDEASAAAVALGIPLVRGTELSCRLHGRSVHLLGYLYDPLSPALLAEAETVREARVERAHRIVGLLARDMPLTWDDVVRQTGDAATVGRPHIADALVARGHVPDRSAAFDRLLATGSPYWVPHYAPDAAHAIGLVLGAGGVPVLAHPGAAHRDRPVDDEEIDALVEAGLAGLEVDHRDNDETQRTRLRAAARRHGLLETGSSDYHGTGKPNRLGENLTSAEVLAEITRRGRLEVVR